VVSGTGDHANRLDKGTLTGLFAARGLRYWQKRRGTMPDIDWKLVVAIWGAVTGSVSLLLALFSKRPRFHLEPFWKKAPNSLSLVVNNPAPSPLMVSSVWTYSRWYEFRPAQSSPESALDSVRHAGRLLAGENVPLYLKAGETGHFDISIKNARPAVAVVWWHRNWLFVRMPSFVPLSRRIADDVNRAVS
jgi:hypothetical protein